MSIVMISIDQGCGSRVWANCKGIDQHSTMDVFSAHDPMTQADLEMTKNNQLASTLSDTVSWRTWVLNSIS